MTHNVLWSRASVCVSVRSRTPTLLHGPGCNLGHGSGCPLVVHLWADLQSVHGLRCYGNIMRTLVTSLRPSRDMTTQCERSAGSARAAGGCRGRSQNCAPYMASGRRWLAVDRGRSRHYCSGLDCGLPLAAFWQHNTNAKC